jgi:LysM repeat protein
VAISSYASMDKHVPSYLTSRLTTVNAEAVMVGEGGQTGDVTLGRYSTIIKPVAIPTAAPMSHNPFNYTVLAGETVSTIAAKFHVSVSQLRWSNSNLYSDDTVATGDQIVIPPIPGVVVVVKANDTLDVIAGKYQVDAQSIYDFNRLRTPQLVAGTVLVVPGGVGGAFPPPPSVYQQLMQLGIHSSFQVTRLNCCLGPYTSPAQNKFPGGWCTYYVATKRLVTWTGDAGWWYQNASAKGYSVGATPKPGAIMVTWESNWGHVAYVESVNPDGSWVVTEMNYMGFWVIDQRVIKPGSLARGVLVGFIY